jgi:hypothetical protein
MWQAPKVITLSGRCLVNSILTRNHGRVIVVATPCAALASGTKKASGLIRAGVPCRAAIAISRTRNQVALRGPAI